MPKMPKINVYSRLDKKSMANYFILLLNPDTMYIESQLLKK